MHFPLRAARVALAAAIAITLWGCSILRPAYEYEEELWLSTDGSGTVDVNASLEALRVLRGIDVDPGARARADRERVRAVFVTPGVEVQTPTFYRRNGRQFVHVRIEFGEVSSLPRVGALAWSSYRLERDEDRLVFHQDVGRPAIAPAGGASWQGDELVAFRVHVPSKVLFENATSDVQRGNIVTWEQPLSSRLAGEPVQMRIDMQPESILYTTLLLFGATVLLAAATFAGVVVWLRRRGAATDAADAVRSPPAARFTDPRAPGGPPLPSSTDRSR